MAVNAVAGYPDAAAGVSSQGIPMTMMRSRPRRPQSYNKAINRQISLMAELGDIGQFLGVIQVYLPDMNGFNLSTALHRVAKLSSTDDNEGKVQMLKHSPVFRQLFQEVHYHITTHSLSSGVTASMLITGEDQTLPPMQLQARQMSGNLSAAPGWEMPVQCMSIVSWSCATLRIADRLLLGAIAQIVSPRLDDLKPFELSNLLWAYAKVHLVPPELFRSAERRLAMRTRSEFKAQCLSTIAWAFATAERRDPKVFSMLAMDVKANATNLKTQEISSMLWAFAKTRAIDVELFNALGNTAIEEPRIWMFKAQELSNTVWAFATVGLQHRRLFDKVEQAAISKRNEMLPQNIANVLWSYAKLQVRATKLFLSLLEVAVAKLDQYKRQEISTVTWAAAQVVPSHAGFFGAVSRLCVQRLQEFSPNARANLVRDLSAVGTDAPEAFHAIVREATKALPRFDPGALGIMLRGMLNAMANPALQQRPAQQAEIMGTYLAVCEHLLPRVRKLRPAELQDVREALWDRSSLAPQTSAVEEALEQAIERELSERKDGTTRPPPQQLVSGPGAGGAEGEGAWASVEEEEEHRRVSADVSEEASEQNRPKGGVSEEASQQNRPNGGVEDWHSDALALGQDTSGISPGRIAGKTRGGRRRRVRSKQHHHQEKDFATGHLHNSRSEHFDRDADMAGHGRRYDPNVSESMDGHWGPTYYPTGDGGTNRQWASDGVLGPSLWSTDWQPVLDGMGYHIGACSTGDQQLPAAPTGHSGGSGEASHRQQDLEEGHFHHVLCQSLRGEAWRTSRAASCEATGPASCSSTDGAHHFTLAPSASSDDGTRHSSTAKWPEGDPALGTARALLEPPPPIALSLPPKQDKSLQTFDPACLTELSPEGVLRPVDTSTFGTAKVLGANGCNIVLRHGLLDVRLVLKLVSINVAFSAPSKEHPGLLQPFALIKPCAAGVPAAGAWGSSIPPHVQYLAYCHCRHGNLSEWMVARVAAGRPVTAPEAARVAQQILSTVEDVLPDAPEIVSVLRPDEIFVDTDERPLLRKPLPGKPAGWGDQLKWISPDEASGEAQANKDLWRTVCFGLGMLLYYMNNGTPTDPYPGREGEGVLMDLLAETCGHGPAIRPDMEAYRGPNILKRLVAACLQPAGQEPPARAAVTSVLTAISRQVIGKGAINLQPSSPW